MATMLRRKPVNKKRSASRFRRSQSRIKAANVRPLPMRGGIRL